MEKKIIYFLPKKLTENKVCCINFNVYNTKNEQYIINRIVECNKARIKIMCKIKILKYNI